jgi:hypothetical protein
LPSDFDAPGRVNFELMRWSPGIAQSARQNPAVDEVVALVEKWIGVAPSVRFAISDIFEQTDIVPPFLPFGFSAGLASPDRILSERQIPSVEEGGITDRATNCILDEDSVVPHSLPWANALAVPEFWAPCPCVLRMSEPGLDAACSQVGNANVGRDKRTLPFPAAQWAAVVAQAQRSIPDCQVAFLAPKGTQIRFNQSPTGEYDTEPLTCPARHNLPCCAIYRLRLTNVPGYPNSEFYPTLEIGPMTPRTEAFLTHNAIPIQFNEDDFQEASRGRFVKKVVYLPDPEFQESTIAAIEILVSTQLDPGVDPIIEADRRGAILAVLRSGPMDIQKAVCEQQVPSRATVQPQPSVSPERLRSCAAVPSKAGTGEHPPPGETRAELRALPDLSNEAAERIPEAAPQTTYDLTNAGEKAGSAVQLRRAARHLEAAGKSELAAQIRKEALLATKIAQLEKLQTEIAKLRRTISTDHSVVVQVRIMELQVSKMSKLGIDFQTADGAEGEESKISKLVDGVGIDSLIPALRQNGLLKVLAEPTIVTRSGRPATFQSGGEFPIVVSQPAGGQSVEYRSFGTRLDCLARVLEDDRIRLEFRCTVSEIDDSRSVSIQDTTVPGLRTRSIDTAVDVVAGQTVVFNGVGRKHLERKRHGGENEETSLLVAVTADLDDTELQTAENDAPKRH